MFIVSCVQQSVGEECSNAATDFHVSDKNLYNMDLGQKVREQKFVVGSSLETATGFAQKDLLPLDVSDINQNESEDTATWTGSQTTTEIALSTSLATTMQLDPTGKVKIFFSVIILKTYGKAILNCRICYRNCQGRAM